jgi:hypothetical protein
MNVRSRDDSLKQFREDPAVRVLLMSLKAGGVALNLTVSFSFANNSMEHFVDFPSNVPSRYMIPLQVANEAYLIDRKFVQYHCDDISFIFCVPSHARFMVGLPFVL